MNRKYLSRLSKVVVSLFGMLFIIQATAAAHVKWFSDFSFSDKPLSIGQAVDTTFILLALLSIAVISGMVYLDRQLAEATWYNRINDWLKSQSEHSLTVLRVAAGAVLLLSWQADAMLVPELSVSAAWIGWLQFLLALLLCFRKTVPLAGAGLIALYGIGIYQFGMFHMLDYPMYAGAGYYFLVNGSRNERMAATGLPALYFTVGFSLCWVALEKIIYPQWGLYVLQQNPQLAMGFDLDFFLVGAAFVEFTLGYLLIICLLQRPLSLVITLVFFTTTMVFGKLEIIGHTLIHGALIVFLFEGPGSGYKAPITLHKNLKLRTAFAAVNFALLLAVLLSVYTYGAWQKYENYNTGKEVHSGQVIVSDSAAVPEVELNIKEDTLSGWNIHLQTRHFRFTPEKFGQAHVVGEGHAHLYLDGKKIARIYNSWYHLNELLPGMHTLSVTLNSNNHDVYVFDGAVISDKVEITVE